MGRHRRAGGGGVEMQTAWLIERRDTSQTCWLAWHVGSWLWTSDANEATKFADEKSARQIMEYRRDTFPVFVCEHAWPDGF